MVFGRLVSALLLGGLLFAGCDVFGTVCPAEVRPAVEVQAVSAGPDPLAVDGL